MESKIKDIINETIYNEIKRTIMEDTKKMEVYHIMCDGEPIDSFETMEKAEEALPKYKKSHPNKELIIEKGTYESHEDMIEKLDKMGEELEELENKTDKKGDMKPLENNEGNEFTAALMKAKKEGKDKFTVDGKEYDVKESWQKLDEESSLEFNDLYSIWEKYSDNAFETHNPSEFSDEFEYADNIISHIVQSAIDNGDIREEDGDNLSNDIKDEFGENIFDMFTSEGGEIDDEEDVTEGKGMCSECGGMLNEEGQCNECGTMKESTKKTLRMGENEFINLMRKMLYESMKGDPGTPGIPGLTTTKRAQRASEKQNQDNMKEVKNKMKKYLSFDGNDNPEFPKAIGKGDKMAINNTEKQDEEVGRNFAGLQNLDYDLQPSEKFIERMKKAIEGHSTMGNAPTTETPTIKPSNDADKGKVAKEKIGNVVNSEKAKQKLNKQIKDRLQDKKNRVLYNKENVPVNTKKVNESVEEKNILLEELEKMKKLSNYNKKTQ